MDGSLHRAFAPCPLGVEDLLVAELAACGAVELRPTAAGVAFMADLAGLYRACLWSRVASRVLLHLAEVPADSDQDYYQALLALPWERHFPLPDAPTSSTAGDGDAPIGEPDGGPAPRRTPGSSFAVHATGRSPALRNSHYAALRLKDAVVDRLRAQGRARPNVDKHAPDLWLAVHIEEERATVSLDLSGDSLHRRGYRHHGGPAPLKENLAAAVLLRAGWPAIAAAGGALVDPMCGGGTLLIEAAWIALDTAPGLLRQRFGFMGWAGHDARRWDGLRAEAQARQQRASPRRPRLVGRDADAAAIERARRNVARAGLVGLIDLATGDLEDLGPPGRDPGLLVVNPPYGERLSRPASLVPLYARLGAVLRERFGGWRATILTEHEDLAHATGLRAARVHTLFNGGLRCTLLHAEIFPAHAPQSPAQRPSGQPPADPGPGLVRPARAEAATSSAFANRLRKNAHSLSRWAQRQGVSCYRVYDRDIPEYAVVVDLYEGRWAHVQEYAPPADVDEVAAARRLRDVLIAVPAVLGIEPADLFLKQRRRQRPQTTQTSSPRDRAPAGARRAAADGSSTPPDSDAAPGRGRRTGQYQRIERGGSYERVNEGGLRFEVNFTDHLDTGLFLDGRLIRARLRELAAGRHALNLFCYTGSATVAMGAGGAASTLSLDASSTYLAWAARNLALNGLDNHQHRLQRADCLRWLAEEHRGRYGLIYLDPPTFSARSTTGTLLDVQRDHVALIRSCERLLAPGGVLVFSTNAQRFTLDAGALTGLTVTDVSAATLPHDFKRHRAHRCYVIRPG